jgi:putative ABC transport system substrate-binding protein
MRRRDFIAGLGAAAFPLAARGQGERARRVAALVVFPESDPLGRTITTAFARELARLRWTEGNNIRIDYRFAAIDAALAADGAAKLLSLSPDAMFAAGTAAAEALAQRTQSIPIVFTLVNDPVGMGLVRSLPRPGGNVTGFSAYDIPMMGKWLDLLAKVAPAVMRVAVIFHPESASWTAAYNDAIKQYASSFGMMIRLAPVHDDAEIERAIAEHARDAGGALLVMPEAFSISHRDTIIAAATRYRLPTIGMNDILPRAGGLMSYAVDPAEASAQAASYIDRILMGHQAGRPAGPNADQAFLRHQSQNRESIGS